MGGGNDGLVGIYTSFDGSGYFLLGWYNYNLSNAIYDKPWLIKVNNNGTVIWDKMYGGNKVSGIFKGAIQQIDSTIILYGSIHDTLGMSNAGLILKTKKTGDSLWAREYKRTLAQDDYFNGFCATNDGGFILAGQVNQNGTPSNTQDGWLIKVDCLGADSITQYLGNSCYAGNPSGINELTYDYSSAALGNNYPNPFYEKTTIPYNLNESDKNAELHITDITGKMLSKYQLQNDKNAINVDMSTLQSGFYFYSLYINHKLISTKKMVLSK